MKDPLAILVSVFATVLAGCVSTDSASELSPDSLCQNTLPAGSRLRSNLTINQISSDGINQSIHLFLAIDTRSTDTQVYLLSLQGLPLYHLSCNRGRANERHLSQMPDSLPPASLMRYLAQLYTDTATINNTDGQLHIKRNGNAPWYDSLHLEDPQQALIIHLENQLDDELNHTETDHINNDKLNDQQTDYRRHHIHRQDPKALHVLPQ
ncbi:MAG: hypothetical protein ACK5ME_07220 [Parahaliea sp.]